MKKPIVGKPVFRICFYAQVVLLTFLSYCSMGQEDLTAATVSSMEQDSLLVNQYMKAARKRGTSADSALMLLSKALPLAKKNGLEKTVGVIWNMIGNRMLQKGNFTDCQLYLDSGFALNEQLNDAELTCLLNTLAARMHQLAANYAKAASHYFRAIHAVQENDINNPRAVAQLYHSLGGLMISLDEDSLANHYLLLSKQNALEVEPVDSAFLANILMTLAQAHEEKDPNVAISFFKDAYTTAEKYNWTPLSFTILANLTQNYIKLGNYDSAEHYLSLANLFAEPGRAQVKAEALSGLLAYHKKDYTTSIRHLQNALRSANEEDEHLEEIYDVFAKVYAARGAYQKAYEFHKKYMDEHNRLNYGQKITVADFMLSLQGAEHEKTILQKQAEISSGWAAIRKQRTWIAILCLLSVLLCVILVMAYRNYRNKKSMLSQQMRALQQDQEIERLKAEAEGADNERTRIAYDLHDGVMVRLANVKTNLKGLSNIYPDFSGNNHFRDIVEQLDTAAGELRNTAHNLMPQILLEDGLAQAIFYFCKTTEQASGLNIKFQQVGELLPRLQIQVETAVYRIVQGLVQNVIQHAKATTCLVQLQYSENFCSVTVEDNGQGISGLEKSEGYGLKSIRSRTKILHGTFDIKSDKDMGTTAYIEFDVRPFLREGKAL